MLTVRCEYCHQDIEQAKYAVHRATHEQLRPDGQQNEYVTLPPEQREAGDLTGVPRVYIHAECGAATGMPESIIRSYLKNPFLYSGDTTYCTGCKTHVPDRECNWQETGENLQVYTRRLQAENPHLKPGLLKRILHAFFG